MKMKKIIGVLVLVLLVSAMVAALPARTTPGGAAGSGPGARTAANRNMVNDNGLILSEAIRNVVLNQDLKCSGALANNCWKIVNNNLITVGSPENGGYKPDLTYNAETNALVEGAKVFFFSSDGLFMVRNGDLFSTASIDDGGVVNLRGLGTIPNFDPDQLSGPIQTIGTPGNEIPIIPLTENRVAVGSNILPKDMYEQYVQPALLAGGTVKEKKIDLPAATGQTVGTITFTETGGNYQITITPTAASGETATPQQIYRIGGATIVEEGNTFKYDGETYSGKDNKVDFNTGTISLHGEDSSIEIKKDNDGNAVVTTCESDKCSGNTDRVVKTVKTDGSYEEQEFEGSTLDRLNTYDKDGNLLSEAALGSDGQVEGIDQYGYYAQDRNGNYVKLKPGEEGYGEPANRRVSSSCPDKECKDGVVEFNWASGSVSCGTGQKCTPQQLEAAQDKLDDIKWQHGESRFQQGVRRFLSGPSAAGLANHWEGYREWMQTVDRFFAANYLGVEPVSSAICENLFSFDVEEPEGVALVETQSGTWQVVAHIEAEKTNSGPLPCEIHEENGEESCPAELECREDHFCYDERADSPKNSWFYKITWEVIAPRDEAFTPNINEDGQAVTFNLELRGAQNNVMLFQNSRTGIADRNAIGLNNGNRSSVGYPEVIADYSIYDFNEACIVWGESRPLTLKRGCFDLGDNNCLTPIGEERCSAITVARPVSVQEAAGEQSVAGSTNEGHGEYCGLNGC